MIGNGKEEYAPFYDKMFRKSPMPSENRLTAILNRKKPKSISGFKPGQPRQNANALPLVPPLRGICLSG